MQEGQATIEGNTLPMDKPFMVLATQNPIELEGTYPLPEAQKDRFLMMCRVEYPSLDDELDMLKIKNTPNQTDGIKSLADRETISRLIDGAKKVRADDYILRYIRDISVTTRNNPDLALGASPRASEHLLRAVKARALISGRTHATPDDVKKLVAPILLHRLILTIDAELQEITLDTIIKETIRTAPQISNPHQNQSQNKN
jgi:MoxR-like ATPase